MLGELLLTAGVVAFLFVAWQMWLGDEIIGAQKNDEASAPSRAWSSVGSPPSPMSTAATIADGDIRIATQPGHGEIFGVMSIPRFGSNWQFKIAVGTSRKDILDQGEVGHYPDTAMRGQVGNTVYAAHRWTSGDPFGPIDTLVVGDPIIIQTPDGWFTYRYRNTEYVQASQVDVLLPVPQLAGVEATARLLTLTSCAPKYNMQERIIAYAVFESFTPTEAGMPSTLSGRA